MSIVIQFIFFLFIIFIVIFFLFFFFSFQQSQKKKKISSVLDMTLYLVRMPYYEEKGEKEKRDLKQYLSAMEQFFSSCFYLKDQRLVLEIASERGQEDISFYFAVPSKESVAFENTFYGLFPNGILEKIPQDYTIFEKTGVVLGSFLKQKNTYFLPLNTYAHFQEDSLKVIVNSLSEIKPEEGAAVQVVVLPSGDKVKKDGEKVLGLLANEGKTLKEAVFKVRKDAQAQVLRFINSFFDTIFQVVGEIFKPHSSQSPPPVGKKEEEFKPKPRKVDDITIEAIRAKIKKPIFQVNVRLVVMAQNEQRAQEILSKMEGAFKQFDSSFNQFIFQRVSGQDMEEFLYDFSFRVFKKSQENILNAEELASIYHFPIPQTKIFGLKTAKTKEVPPPSELPKQGEIMIGYTAYRQSNQPVFIKTVADRRRHFYIVGQTGTGKSSLLHELIRQDIQSGRGVGVIDPHGDLIEGILTTVPPERYQDIVLFEPFDMERVPGLNMLEWETPEEKDFAVSEMIMIFHKLFPPEIIGPMFEHYMRNAMLALMADKTGTLVDIPRIFTDEEFMEWKLQHVDDPLVRNFWLREWKQTIGQTRSEMLGYVVSKVGRFVENTMMRNIIGQANSSFDLTKIMDEGKIFLANLSKGQTGELNSSLLGLILVSKMQMAAMRRAKIPEEQRRDFFLYIDEFQNFTTDSVATILSEARKYRLNLILAHQYMPQLKDEIKNAVIGNVGSFGVFRVGATDAEFLEKIFEPEFSKSDLVNLDNFSLILRLMIDNKITSPFKVRTARPQLGDRGKVEEIKVISKLKYTKPRAIVEREILERSRLAEL